MTPSWESLLQQGRPALGQADGAGPPRGRVGSVEQKFFSGFASGGDVIEEETEAEDEDTIQF